MLGLTQKEKDLKESDRLFAELTKLPPVVVDDALDEECIRLTVRLIGAEKCGSPKANDIQKQLVAKMNERDRQKGIAERERQRILDRIAQNSSPYRAEAHRKLTRRTAEVIKLYETEAVGESKNYFNDQITRKIRTNEQTVDEIRDRILADRTAIFAMQDKPLREILTKIDEHNMWYRSLELDELQPETIVEIPGAIPKWARP